MQRSDMVPVTVATIGTGVSRERAIRGIQLGHISGERRDGRWYCSRDDLERFAAATAHAEPAPSAA